MIRTVCSALLALSLCTPVYAAVCDFVWDNPTVLSDGTPFVDHKETRLYLRGQSAAQAIAPAPANEKKGVPCVDGQVWYATAVRTNGVESAPSNDAVVMITPGSPKNVRVQVIVDVTVTP
jgi:hypothetical protein